MNNLTIGYIRFMVKPRLKHIRRVPVLPILVRQASWTNVDTIPGATIQLHIKPRRDYLYIVRKKFG